MPAVGTVLSEYRRRKRLSQLELSMLAEVSSRHISFIETGRTRPSRGMLLRLAEVLHLPHRDSNLLLSSGGYAAAYTHLDLDSPDMAPVRDALQRILDNHNPLPALVMDGDYNLLMANTAQQQLFAQALGNASPLPSGNVLEAVFLENGFRPLIVNWDEVAGHLLRRLRRQVLAWGKPEQEALLERLQKLAPPQDWQTPHETAVDGPMLTVGFRVGDLTLSMFTTITQFGAALDTGMEEILIESYFPADEACREFFLQLSQ